MHTIEEHKQKKLERLLDTLRLSPNNRAMALAYLASEPCDDSLLQKAEHQNFRELDWSGQHASAEYMEALRRAGREELARYIKLYWAIGKSTAIFILEDNRAWMRGEEDRTQYIAAVGKSAAAAMEAERYAWHILYSARQEWLYQLAAQEPQVLEEAQNLGGTSYGNMSVILAGILLCRGKREPQGILQRLTGGKDPMIARQRTLLENYLLKGVDAVPLTEKDKKALGAYIQKGETDLQLPILSVATAYGARPRRALDTRAVDDYLAALMGTAAFLA